MVLFLCLEQVWGGQPFKQHLQALYLPSITRRELVLSLVLMTQAVSKPSRKAACVYSLSIPCIECLLGGRHWYC